MSFFFGCRFVLLYPSLNFSCKIRYCKGICAEGIRIRNHCADPCHILHIHALNLRRIGGTAILNDENVIIQRKPIIAGGTDAVRGGCSRQNHGFHAQTAQNQIQLCLEKSGKTRLYNCIIPLLRRKFRRHLDRQRARAVGCKVTIAAKPAVIACKFHITAVSAINAVHEEYRNPSFSRLANHPAAGRHAFCRLLNTQGRFLADKCILHINHNQSCCFPIHIYFSSHIVLSEILPYFSLCGYPFFFLRNAPFVPFAIY